MFALEEPRLGHRGYAVRWLLYEKQRRLRRAGMR